MSSSNKKRVFVGNLHPSVTEGDLITFFGPIGKIQTVNYVWHYSGPKRGQPRGFAFVEFTTAEDAARSIQRLNNCVLRGRRVVIRNEESDRPDSGKGSASEVKAESIVDSRKRTRVIDDQISKIMDTLKSARVRSEEPASTTKTLSGK